MKKNKFIIIGLAIVVLAVLGVFVAKKIGIRSAQNKAVAGESVQNTDSQIILFVGNGCPHCKNVEDYIQQNQINSKISFQTKEVFYDKNNQSLLEAKAKACNLSTDSIGVPFLWTGSQCIQGDQPIIDYFNQQVNK